MEGGGVDDPAWGYQGATRSIHQYKHIQGGTCRMYVVLNALQPTIRTTHRPTCTQQALKSVLQHAERSLGQQALQRLCTHFRLVAAKASIIFNASIHAALCEVHACHRTSLSTTLLLSGKTLKACLGTLTLIFPVR